jgi:hypothetical protein
MGNNSVSNANEVNAQSETLAGGQPNGQPGALQIGSNYYYGDSQNAAVRTPGSFYIQNQNGSGPADIAEVNNVWGSGELQGGYINSTGDSNAQNALTVGPANGLGPYGFYAYQNGYSGTSDTFTVGSRVILGTAFGSANIGWGCSPNGEIAANANGSGQVLACQGGSWQAMGGTSFNVGTTGSASSDNGQAFNLGNWDLCYLMGSAWTYNGFAAVYPTGGPYSNGQYSWQAYATGYSNGNAPTVVAWVCGNFS